VPGTLSKWHISCLIVVHGIRIKSVGIISIGIGEVSGITLDAKERDQDGGALGYNVVSTGYRIIFSALSIEEW